MARKALGRGLASLIPAAVNREVAVAPELRTVEPRQGEIQHVALDKIVRNPAQPRTQFDPATIHELANSIRERGVLQPVLVRPSAGAVPSFAGGRRGLPARPAGALPAVPGERAQNERAKSAAAPGWSVRELEERVRRLAGGRTAARARKSPKRAFSSELMGLEDDLMRALGSRVRITRRRGGTGSIFIDYHSEEELDRLVNVLRSLTVDAR